jgi:hypothetical protein
MTASHHPDARTDRDPVPAPELCDLRPGLAAFFICRPHTVEAERAPQRSPGILADLAKGEGRD